MMSCQMNKDTAEKTPDSSIGEILAKAPIFVLGTPN